MKNNKRKTTTMAQKELIEHNFTYHAPTGDKPQTYTDIRNKAKELALLFDEKCPQSRELSLAMTKLEEAVMWVNAGIARN